MLEFNDIEINNLQLNTLLNHHEMKAIKYLLKNEIHCCNCDCRDTICNYTLFLDRFNDIRISGQCTECGSEISITMAFGENETFFRKAIQFRYTQAILIES